MINLMYIGLSRYCMSGSRIGSFVSEIRLRVRATDNRSCFEAQCIYEMRLCTSHMKATVKSPIPVSAIRSELSIEASKS